MHQSDTPNLRFREFHKSFEKKLLSEIGLFKNLINKDAKDFGHGFPIVNLMDVFGKSQLKKHDFGLVNATNNELIEYAVEKGDVLFIRSSVKRTGVGETSVLVDSINNLTFSGFLIRFRDCHLKLDLNYKRYCFQSRSVRNQILRYATTSANTNINQESLKKITLKIPEENEQKKISTFLTAVDSKIDKLTRKKELLEEYKKGAMQKLFSREIRFKDENGNDYPDWECMRLKKLLEVVVDNRGKTPPVENQGIPLIEVNSLGKRKIDYSSIRKYVNNTIFENWFRKYLKKGDILFSTVGNTAICSIYEQNFLAVVAQNIVGLRFKDKYYGNFFYYLLTETKNNNMFKRIQMGAVQPSVKVSQMINIDFHIPQKPEQEKIALFLTSIDKKIENVSFQIEKTKEFKTGLLQRMFV